MKKSIETKLSLYPAAITVIGKVFSFKSKEAE